MVADPSLWVEESDKYDTEKHKAERVAQGFSEYDWWNFCDYMAWVNIRALEKFKEGAGYPADLNNMDEWKSELDIMIAGFEAHMTFSNLEYDFRNEEAVEALRKKQDDGLTLYTKRFSALWD